MRFNREVFSQLLAEVMRVESGEVCDGPMCRQDDQAWITHVNEGRHHEFRGCVWISLASRRAARVAVRQRSLVTVVSIRDVKLRFTQRVMGRLDCRGVGNFPEVVYDAVVVGCGQGRFAFGSGEGIALWTRVQHEDLALLRTARSEEHTSELQ